MVGCQVQRIVEAATGKDQALLVGQLRDFFDRTQGERVSARGEARFDDVVHILDSHRSEAEALTIPLDLDQRLQPEQAPGSVANDRGVGRQGVGQACSDIVGPHRPRG